MNNLRRYRLVCGLMALSAMTAGLALGLDFSVAQAREAYPSYVTNKKLYAARDLRGQGSPRLVIKQWLTPDGKAPDCKGKVVLIDFWATWCPPCRKLVPELNEYQKKFGDDLVVIGISDEEPSTVRAFIKERKIEYAVGLDADNEMSERIGISGIPHVLIISADGVVRWQGFPTSPEDPLSEETLAQIIAASKSDKAKP